MRRPVLRVSRGILLACWCAGCSGGDAEPTRSAGNMPLEPGSAVSLELHSSAYEALSTQLEQSAEQSAEELAAEHAVSFRAALGYDPLAAQNLELILQGTNHGLLRRDDTRRAALAQNGFYIDRSSGAPSFPYGYTAIYAQHLPVYITADMVLEALHRSYDAILQTLERQALAPRLGRLLASMASELDAGKLGSAPELAADVGFYLSVARSLLESGGRQEAGDRGGTEVRELVQAALAAEGEQRIVLFGVERAVDFSQFRPRGHYAGDPTLEGYFRAMIWLGRTDFRLIETLPDGARVFRRRQLDAAYGLRTLMDEQSLESFRYIDAAIGGLVGEHDEMTLSQLERLLSDLELDTPMELAQLPDELIAQAIIDANYGDQRIASQVMHRDASGPATLPLSASFALFGQRYTVDSHVFSNVVYDRVPTRVVPDPLDAAFGAFGNDQALALLQDQLSAESGYPAALGRVRTLVDAHPAEYWEGSFYTGWLGALRALSPASAGVGASGSDLPSFAQTEAWGRRVLNTQLASWAELRRDNVLYVKQSYTSNAACDFPDAYVDPYPEFFYRVVRLAERASVMVEELPLAADLSRRMLDYFANVARINQTLGDMADFQRRGVPHSAEQLAFVNQAIDVQTSCDGTVDAHNGWYRDLFYEPLQAVELDPTIADVHTDIGGDLPVSREPSVLHVATGYPRLMLVTVDSCSGPRAYAGYVFGYHELRPRGLTRFTDEEWEQRLSSGDLPREVPWLQPVLVSD
jgi:uncharacterized protein DUF3160